MMSTIAYSTVAIIKVSQFYRPKVHLASTSFSRALNLHSSFGNGNFEPTMMDDQDETGDDMYLNRKLQTQAQREALLNDKRTLIMHRIRFNITNSFYIFVFRGCKD